MAKMMIAKLLDEELSVSRHKMSIFQDGAPMMLTISPLAALPKLVGFMVLCQHYRL